MSSASKSANLHSYMARTANHSTKPFKRGANLHLCDEKPVDYIAEVQAARLFNDFERDEQFRNLKLKRAKLHEKQTAIALKLKETLPIEDYEKLKAKRIECRDEGQQLDRLLYELKKQRKGIITLADREQLSFERIFMRVASASLPKDTYDALIEATRKASESEKL